jgi:hypothetical protein
VSSYLTSGPHRLRTLLLWLAFGAASSTGALVGLAWLHAVLSGASEALEEGKHRRAVAELAILKSSVLNYAIDNEGRFPDTLAREDFLRPYLETSQLPLDPWGTPYQYLPQVSAVRSMRLWSLAADRSPGGVGAGADIDLDEAQGQEEPPR